MCVVWNSDGQGQVILDGEQIEERRFPDGLLPSGILQMGARPDNSLKYTGMQVTYTDVKSFIVTPFEYHTVIS